MPAAAIACRAPAPAPPQITVSTPAPASSPVSAAWPLPVTGSTALERIFSPSVS